MPSPWAQAVAAVAVFIIGRWTSKVPKAHMVAKEGRRGGENQNKRDCFGPSTVRPFSGQRVRAGRTIHQ